MNAPAPVPTTSDVQLLREVDAARFLAVTPRTLRSWRGKGKIEYVLIGSTIRYSIADLAAFISERRTRCTSINDQKAPTGGRPLPSKVCDIASARDKRKSAPRR